MKRIKKDNNNENNIEKVDKKNNKKNIGKNKNKKNAKRAGASPIRGSEDPYLGTLIERIFNELMRSTGVINPELLSQWRDMVKCAVATYYKHAASINNHNAIIITEACKTIIRNRFRNNQNVHVYNTMNCCIDYYNGTLPPVIQLKMNIPECNAKKVYKAFSQATRNKDILVKKRVKKLIKKLMSRNFNNINNDVIQQYIAIPIAVDYVSAYFRAINYGTLPKVLDVRTYNLALTSDLHISRYYEYDSTDCNYKLFKKRAKYTALTPECGTIVFCETH